MTFYRGKHYGIGSSAITTRFRSSTEGVRWRDTSELHGTGIYFVTLRFVPEAAQPRPTTVAASLLASARNR